jgi:hypothetical protein
MNRAELIKFISDPAGLNMASEAGWLSEATAGICGWVALAGAVVVANAAFGLQGTEAASKSAPRDPKVAVILLLSGAGIGALMAGGACARIKLEIDNFTNSFASAREAILKLTPQVRQKLIAEAQKLVRMRRNIDEALKPEREPRFTLSA